MSFGNFRFFLLHVLFLLQMTALCVFGILKLLHAYKYSIPALGNLFTSNAILFFVNILVMYFKHLKVAAKKW